MIDLFKENIIASFDKTPIIYPQDSYQIVFSHEGADFYEILNQFEYSRDITLLRQLSIYNLTKKEYITFFSSLTAIEIVSILKLILPKLDIFLYQSSIDDLINELDTSITYQEILYHNRSSPYLSSMQKKKVLLNLLQIVDKLDENINWAIPNWYFHFLFA